MTPDQITTAPVSTAASGTPEVDRSVGSATAQACRSPFGTYPECPLCGGGLFPEHAHFKCSGCGWRDSCCD